MARSRHLSIFVASSEQFLPVLVVQATTLELSILSIALRVEGKEYVQYCRRLISDNQKVPSVHDIMPTGPEAPPEHVILDVNVKAQHHLYYSIGAFKVRTYHYYGIFSHFLLACFLTSKF